MSNTYKKVYLHVIFAVKNREALLDKVWRHEVFSYISGILNKRGHYALAVNGHHDHIHVFFDYSCKELISDLVREIKKASSAYIKKKRYSRHKFQWQNGYGVFSHGYREKGIIIEYIRNQEEHHSKKTFQKEYMAILKAFEIEFKEDYVFEFFD